MGRSKAKGYRYERELVEWLWRRGYAATRIPASGAANKHPVPDIVAGNGRVYLAIELKMRAGARFYVSKSQVERLYVFARRFGATPLVVFKIPYVEYKAIIVEEPATIRVSKDEFQKMSRLSEILEALEANGN